MITSKSYSLEVLAGTEWVPLGFEYMTGSFDETQVPYVSGSIRAQVPPAVLSYTNPLTKAKLRFTAQTPGLAEFPYLYVVEREQVSSTLYDFDVISEDGILDDYRHPGIPGSYGYNVAEPRSWRELTTLEQLIPAVCAVVGLTVSPTMPVAGVKCSPAYQKDQLIQNPTHKTGGEAWATGDLDTSYTPGDGWADFHHGNPGASFKTMIAGLFHPDGKPPSVPSGQNFKAGLRVTAPTEWAGNVVRAWVVAKRTVGDIVMWSEGFKSNPGHTLVAGVNDVEVVFKLKPGYSIASVGFEATGNGFMAPIPTTKLRVTRSWLMQADFGDPAAGVEFFTGDTTDDDDYGYDWEQLPNVSPSVRFPVEERALESAVQEVGESYWSVIAPHLAKRGWRLHPAPGRTWQVVPTGATRGTPYTMQKLAWLDSRQLLTRRSSDWGNGVLLLYKWNTRQGPNERTDSYLFPDSTRVLVVDLDEPFVGYGTAQKYYQAAQRAGGEHQYDMPLDFAFTTGRMINTPQSIWLPSITREIGAVSKITFDTRADTMTLHIPSTAEPI